MADDEQFSLCWNNFNTNLSAGFHESLCRGDLVDVTLAAEGQFVKAHRLVLSVCSPYFRKMFTQMPSNQHAFVFLKDVSHTALKDLIQFMYCGEVNVKQEALPAFISTAEALQIKGLTDSDPPSAPPASQQTQQQQQATEAVTVPAPQITQLHNTSAPARTRHRTTATTTRTYKLEAVDADDDDHHQTQTTTKVPQTTQIVIQTSAPSTSTQQVHQIVQGGAAVQQINAVAAPTTTASSSSAATAVTATQKRTLRASGGPHLKRTKNSSTTTSTSVDPLETANDATTSQTQQNTVQAAIVTTGGSSTSKNQQVAEDTEYIDLPLEIPTKSEPDYNEEAGEAEGGEADGTYGEDDYAEMRYDETYFTENEDGNVTGGNSTSATTSKTVIKQQPQSSFSDSSFAAAGDAGDQPNNDAQEAEVLNAKTTAKPLRKRGRPKLHGDTPPQEKLMDKLASACRRTPGVPTVYASTTKGAMKVIYEGHHFRYSFRKGQFSIFQCCYKENKEECRVRVVSDQKRVYPLDGEHTHFVQATDKSVTSVSFEPGEPDEKEVMDDVSEATAVAEPKDNLSGYDVEQYMLAISDEEDCADVVMDERKQPDVALINPNDFREKIKKRLQKALLGKKK